MSDKKRCGKCKHWKKRSEFYKDAGKSDGLHSYCKACHKAYRDVKRKPKKSPWVDAAVRTPDACRWVLCKMTWRTAYNYTVACYDTQTGRWHGVGPSTDMVAIDSLAHQPDRIQWMDIPE